MQFIVSNCSHTLFIIVARSSISGSGIYEKHRYTVYKTPRNCAYLSCAIPTQRSNSCLSSIGVQCAVFSLTQTETIYANVRHRSIYRAQLPHRQKLCPNTPTFSRYANLGHEVTLYRLCYSFQIFSCQLSASYDQGNYFLWTSITLYGFPLLFGGFLLVEGSIWMSVLLIHMSAQG